LLILPPVVSPAWSDVWSLSFGALALAKECTWPTQDSSTISGLFVLAQFARIPRWSWGVFLPGLYRPHIAGPYFSRQTITPFLIVLGWCNLLGVSLPLPSSFPVESPVCRESFHRSLRRTTMTPPLSSPFIFSHYLVLPAATYGSSPAVDDPPLSALAIPACQMASYFNLRN